MRDAHRAATRLIGWREHVALPDLGVLSLKAKIDTGARTSAIHAVDIQCFSKGGEKWVAFAVPLAERGSDRTCEAQIIDERSIKNTSGRAEMRFIIRTNLVMGRRRWQIELSLADRQQMGFGLILGRTAIRKQRVLVDPGHSFLAGLPELNTSRSPSNKHRDARCKSIKKARPAETLAMEEEE